MKLIETREPVARRVRDDGVAVRETEHFSAPEAGAVMINVTRESQCVVLLWLIADLSIDAGIIGVVQPHEH